MHAIILEVIHAYVCNNTWFGRVILYDNNYSYVSKQEDGIVWAKASVFTSYLLIALLSFYVLQPAYKNGKKRLNNNKSDDKKDIPCMMFLQMVCTVIENVYKEASV